MSDVIEKVWQAIGSVASPVKDTEFEVDWMAADYKRFKSEVAAHDHTRQLQARAAIAALAENVSDEMAEEALRAYHKTDDFLIDVLRQSVAAALRSLLQKEDEPS